MACYSLQAMVGSRFHWRRLHLDLAEVNEKYGARFDAKYDNVGSQRDKEKHTRLRAMMAAGYSKKEVENFEELIDENIASLITLVNRYALESKPMDFRRKAQFSTLDVISSVAYDSPIGYLATDSDLYEYLENMEAILPVFAIRCSPIGFGKIMGVAKQIVGERFGPKKKVNRGMLGSFISHGLNQGGAQSGSLLQIMDGSDTTVTAIRVTFLYIITNLQILAKIRAEIAAKNPSSPATNAEAQPFTYLQAAIKEGLRIWPPLCGLMAQKVPPDGDLINGKFIPGGCQIGSCGFGIFRSKEI
ncbi:cytochrome P450 [Bisporella sp. PMI_857]|nr:cytochrome P450 [Bisporella sp. PMI_857]